MPAMPLPISRAEGVLAVEAAINQILADVNERQRLAVELDKWDADTFQLANDANQAMQDGLFALLADQFEPIKQALITMATAAAHNGAAGDGGAGEALNGPLLDAGIHHMDWDWLSPQNRSAFWDGWTGDAAPIVLEALKTVVAIGDSSDTSVHLVWVCGSPTFEISISESPAQDLVVVLSTPGLVEPDLEHIKPGQFPAIPPSIIDGEGHLVIHGAGSRVGDVVTQDGVFTSIPDEPSPHLDPDQQAQVASQLNRLRGQTTAS